VSARRRTAAIAFPAASAVVARSIGEICGGAVLHVRHDGETIYDAAFGQRLPHGDAVTTDCLFDLASLTKLFAATALLRLFDQRRLSLDDSVAGLFPEFAGADERRAAVTFRMLLTHTSGLPAHVNFRDELGAQAVFARVCVTPLQAAPGSAVVYSDLGFMLVGEAVARIAGAPLAAAMRSLVCDPLGSGAAYRPSRSTIDRIVCTERDEWRNRLLRGEVHDENCWAMGGVAGHAGLFGTAADVAVLAEMYRNGGATARQRVLLRPTAAEAIREQAVGVDERRGLGWALRASDRHSCGSRLSADSFGHTGYTGTSVWVDPQRTLTVVLLTNRVLYSRDPEPIRSLRAAVHDAVVEDLTA
jgi:CubicO group peptidase (beta-lactamase class C family)